MLATGTFDLLTCTSTSLGPFCEAAIITALLTVSVYCQSEFTYLNFVIKMLNMINSVINFNDIAWNHLLVHVLFESVDHDPHSTWIFHCNHTSFPLKIKGLHVVQQVHSVCRCIGVVNAVILLQCFVWQPDNLRDARIFWLPYFLTLTVSTVLSGAWEQTFAGLSCKNSVMQHLLNSTFVSEYCVITRVYMIWCNYFIWQLLFATACWLIYNINVAYSAKHTHTHTHISTHTHTHIQIHTHT